MTSLAKLNTVVSAGRHVRQNLADTALDELRDEWRKVTQEFTAQAKVWFSGGAWNVQDARKQGLLPHVTDAAQSYIDRLANAMVSKIQDARRKAYLSALGANKVTMAVLGQQAKGDAQVVRDGPVRESFRILGKYVTIYREADTPDEGRWVTINGRHVLIKSSAQQIVEAQREARSLMGLSGLIDPAITGQNRTRLIAAIERYVPQSWWNLPRTIRYRTESDPNSEFNGIHGEWTDGKEIVLNPSIFESKETFGTTSEGQLSRAEHTITHEFCHAYGDTAKLDESPEWLSLSGWQHQTGLTPRGKGRYREKRKGWAKEDSSWVHDKGAWFIRPYSAKSPAEDFADCAMAVLVGWADKFDGGGEAKRDWVVSVLGGVSRAVKQKEADKPIDPKDGHWVTINGAHVFIKGPADEKLKEPELDVLSNTITGEFDISSDKPGYRIDAKRRVSKEIAARLVTKMQAGELSREDVVSGLEMIALGSRNYTTEMTDEELVTMMARDVVDMWAETSGDHQRTAVGLQRAIEKEFSVQRSATSHLGFNTDPKVEAMSNNLALRAMVRAEYDNTQAFLLHNGITEAIVYRGMILPDDMPNYPKLDAISKVSLQPASSFTTNTRTAIRFADYGPGSVVLAAKVPANRILSTAQSGAGSIPESEVIILGGSMDGVVISTYDSKALKGNEIRQRDVYDKVEKMVRHVVS